MGIAAIAPTSIFYLHINMLIKAGDRAARGFRPPYEAPRMASGACQSGKLCRALLQFGNGVANCALGDSRPARATAQKNAKALTALAFFCGAELSGLARLSGEG
jgi:hypothetical protein